ncbi:MAG: LysR family transcriptional regulator [Beijerinckiaceae bacterium]
MSDFDDILAFTRVVELESFTRAARRLGISKSMVSRRVGRLEARLGTRLLVRSTRGLTPTEAGRAFAERAGRNLADLEEAQAAVSEGEREPSGLLRIAAPLSFGIMHLAPALAAFQERYPRIAIDVGFSDRFVDLIEDGFDLAVRIGVLKDSSLVGRRLSPIRALVAASPDYLEKHGRPETPPDLLRHRCLSYSGISADEQWRFRVGQRWVTIKPSGPFRADNGEVLRDAAAAGLGITALPSFILSPALEGGALEPLLTDFALPERGLYVLRHGGPEPPLRLRLLIDFLSERFGAEPYWDPCWRHQKIATGNRQGAAPGASRAGA